jgi:hypothetical protein
MLVLRIVSAVVLTLVGLIALSMAWKGLSARRLLPFHQAASGRSWEELSPGERSVGLALSRALGLGFLTAGLALLTAAITAVTQSGVATYALAAVGFVFCAGLTVINRRLQQATSVGTPWKGSLYAAVGIVLAMALYAIG